MELFPRLGALSRADPGEAVAIDFRGGPPVVRRSGRQEFEAAPEAVHRDLVLRIHGADDVAAPAQQFVGAVLFEFQPVDPVRIWASRPRWLHVVPTREPVALPGAAQRFQTAVPCAQPFAELLNRSRAIAIHAAEVGSAVLVRNVRAGRDLEVDAGAAAGVALVPDIVAVERWLVLVMRGERPQERLRARPHLWIIEAESRKPARGARTGVLRHAAIPVLRLEAGFRKLRERPFRSGRDELREHRLNAVLRLQVQHAVVLAPVELAGRGFHRRPQHPVPEHVHAGLGCGLVIAFPLVFRRVGLSEIDRAVRENGIRCGA